MKRICTIVAVIALVVSVLSGCALIFKGTKQKVTFTANSPSMVIDVKTNDVLCQQTPCVAKVRKGYKPREIQFVDANGGRRISELEPHFDAVGAAMLDVLFFWPGLIIDAATASWMGYPKTMGPGQAMAPVYTGPETGIFVGIVAFNSKVEVEPIRQIGPRNEGEFIFFIERQNVGANTALHYAVEEGIKNMKKAAPSRPANLATVSLVTFTDGFDNVSWKKNKIYNSRDEYEAGVKNLIRTTRIKGKQIDAYSIAMPGNDVEGASIARFKKSCTALAYPEKNFTYATNLGQVTQQFQDSARNLKQVNQSQKIELDFPVPEKDTEFCFVFDGRTPEASDQCINARVINVNNITNESTIGGITTKGIVRPGFSTLTAPMNAETLTNNFNFGQLKATNGQLLSLDRENCLFYVKINGRWRRDSEFDPDARVKTTIVRNSALVVLVLDCSRSLQSQFSSIQAAASEFIRILANPNNN